MSSQGSLFTNVPQGTEDTSKVPTTQKVPVGGEDKTQEKKTVAGNQGTTTTTTTKGDVPKDKPASDEAQDDVPTSQ
ncbi:hypothetical protein UCREL1_9936 [Eutypa lata UCREL1]|uniref:Uncharacterized protein n=1 Tax=Eutypa lata (strain UCR-EL1) TaxID=1287681 RepID=M7SFY8_EUTLA|nr:hypothetical protein UCREL1_9936 [Eutypa lata UCREL1]